MQTRLIRKATLAFLLISMTFISTVSYAADWYVKTTGADAPGNGTSSNPFRTISYAVSNAAAGDVIHIGTGTFTEQVEIAKNLTVTGEGPASTVIAAPSTMPLSFYRDIQYLPVLYIHDAIVTIKNLAVDGNTFQSSTAAFAGVAFIQAGGQADNIKVSTAANLSAYSNQFGYGVLVNADNGTAKTVTLSNSTITSFQKFAAGFLGNNLTATVDANTIIGAGKTSAVAQNGILISNQATGTIKNNSVKNFLYTGTDFTAIGIYAINARPTVMITANQLTDCQTGIYCINSGGAQIAQNKIIFNASIYDEDIDYSWGILVENGNYTVTQNEIDGGGEGTGIDAFSYANESTFLNATYNTVKNVETGISTEVDEQPGCATGEIHYNSITNALESLYNNQDPSAGCPIPNDECNWLGTANESDFTDTTKPSHIVGKVDYTPWLTSGTDQQPAVTGFQPADNTCNGGTCRDLTNVVGKETFPNKFNTYFTTGLTNKTFEGSTGTWTVNSNDNATSVVIAPYYSPSSSYALKVVNYKTAYCGTTGWTKAVSPIWDLSNPCCPDNVKFNFTLWTYTVVCNDSRARLEIDFSSDGGATWNEVWSRTSGQLYTAYGANGKAGISIPVPSRYLTSSFRYRIRGEMDPGDGSNFFVFIDDIFVTAPTTCQQLGTIGDYVWKDTNANGKQDAGEPGIPGVTVKLTLPNATVQTKTTDANGYYLFTGLPAGDYTVSFTTPTGYTPTTSNAVGVDNALDSDPVNGSVSVTLASGEVNKTIDAGFKVQSCTNTTNNFETFPNKFNTNFYTSLCNATFTGSAGMWTVNSNNKATLVVTTPYYNPSTSYALKVVNYKTSGCGSGWSKAVSPKVDLSAPCCPSELKMTFTLWTYIVACNDSKAKLEIDFSRDGGNTWTEVWSRSSSQLYYSCGSGGKATVSIAVPLAFQTNNFRYRIRGEMASDDCNNFCVFVDDIKISSPATCSSSTSCVTARIAADGTEETTLSDIAEASIPTVRMLKNAQIQLKENLKMDVGVSVYPNPTTDEFELRFTSMSKETVSVRVIDGLGRVIKSMVVAPNEAVRFGNDFKRGNYIVEAVQGENKQVVKLLKL